MPLIIPPFPKQRMLPKDILDYVSSYYIEDPSRRSFQGEGGTYRCEYLNDKQTKCCGIGLLVTDECRYRLAATDSAIELLLDESELDEKDWRPELQHLALHSTPIAAEFLEELQRFHDRSTHWHAGGLTEEGRGYLDAMREKWDCIERFE